MNKTTRTALMIRLVFVVVSLLTYFATATSARTPSVRTPNVRTPNPSAPRVVTDTNDVMNGKMPRLPVFPNLAKKPGYLRGYVKDSRGKPVQGAYVMITPPALFGSSFSRNSTTVRSDAKGLYEIKIPPSGGCQIWCAGHAVSYNGIRLALPLYPADGEFDTSLPGKAGAVENLVLLPYGVANPSTASDNPVYSGAYYGASFTVGYSNREADDTTSPQQWLPLGSEVEITLTPDGPLMDGSRGMPLVIRQKMTGKSYFQVNNVPIGRYQIRARLLTQGQEETLRIKENIRRDAKGGLEPKEAVGQAIVLFRSESGDPATLRVSGGNMERLELLVERNISAR